MARRQEGVRRDIERTEAAAPNYTRGRVGRVVEDVSREFVRDTRDVAGLEAPVCQGDDHLGIYLFWFDPIHMLKLFLHRKRIW